MEGSTPDHGYVFLFDGPAEEERIVSALPPTPQRWFCQSPEMGSDETTDWWVFDAEPAPIDGGVITEYRIVGKQPVERDEDGDVLIRYTCDDTQWDDRMSGVAAALNADPEDRLKMLGIDPEEFRKAIQEDPAVRDRMSDVLDSISGKTAGERAGFNVAMFNPADVRAVKLGDEWVETPDGVELIDIILEPDAMNAAKVSFGTCVRINTENDGSTVAPPGDISGYKFGPTSIVGDEIQKAVDGDSIRLSAAKYESGDDEVKEALDGDGIEYVEIVHANGTQEIKKLDG